MNLLTPVIRIISQCVTSSSKVLRQYRGAHFVQETRKLFARRSGKSLATGGIPIRRFGVILTCDGGVAFSGMGQGQEEQVVGRAGVLAKRQRAFQNTDCLVKVFIATQGKAERVEII